MLILNSPLRFLPPPFVVPGGGVKCCRYQGYLKGVIFYFMLDLTVFLV